LVGRQFACQHKPSIEELSMNLTKLASIGLAASLVTILLTVSAQAQSPRTFVSAAGSDSNPCSFAAPCRHFQAAVNATSAGGEVDALDPAGYGPITISQAITIEGQGWSYIAPPASGNGITINAVSGNVAIHGVSLNGVGITGSTNGIQFNSGGSLYVRDSVIRNFTNFGLNFQPNSSTPSQLNVSDTLVSDAGSNGIRIGPTGSGTTNGVLNHIDIENSGGIGLFVVTATQTINVTVTDSVSANNTTAGITLDSLGGTLVSAMVRNSTIANNGTDGLLAQGSGATIRVTRSTITGNAIGWTFGSPGAVLSYGDNNIDGNTGANTQPPCVNGTSPCTAYH
jgi:Right handed beta helix region